VNPERFEGRHDEEPNSAMGILARATPIELLGASFRAHSGDYVSERIAPSGRCGSAAADDHR
jgi:hypothetical protein